MTAPAQGGRGPVQARHLGPIDRLQTRSEGGPGTGTHLHGDQLAIRGRRAGDEVQLVTPDADVAGEDGPATRGQVRGRGRLRRGTCAAAWTGRWVILERHVRDGGSRRLGLAHRCLRRRFLLLRPVVDDSFSRELERELVAFEDAADAPEGAPVMRAHAELP